MANTSSNPLTEYTKTSPSTHARKSTRTMMNNNTNTRAFAESIGRAIAFGQDIITCDALLNPQSYGFYYMATDGDPIVVSPTDPKGAYSYWADLLRDAHALSERHDQDPATYGVIMTFDHGRGCVYVNLVRVEYMKSRALDMAENDSVQCPSSIISFGRNEEKEVFYLDKEGRSPYPQHDDPDGRADVEAGRNRKEDDLTDWLSVNVSFEE